jgi:hypothetical protein
MVYPDIEENYILGKRVKDCLFLVQSSATNIFSMK